MKAKNIIVFLIVISGLGAGGYFFQKHRQEQDLVEHNKEKFQQLKQSAKKSSAAGLLVMVSAINKFHKINGRYPKTLMALYPDFIPDKTFITDLNWEYLPKEKTYLVKRQAKGQKRFAAMGPSMRLQTGSIDEPPQPKIAASSGPAAKPAEAAEPEKTETGPDTGSLLAPNLNAAAHAEKKQDTEPASSIRIVKSELSREEAFLKAFDGTSLYIWKTKDGIIGFSNIQYPEANRLNIYRDKNWLEYSISTNAAIDENGKLRD